MDKNLHTINANQLNSLSIIDKQFALSALESGQVIYFPSYSFALEPLEEDCLFSATLLDKKHKNMSFDYRNQYLNGLRQERYELAPTVKAFMLRFSEFARQLVDCAFPQYQEKLSWGRTSYRPAEVEGRIRSKRQDDSRLHVDSFSATPVNGLRILRIFCNINPFNKPRVWHLGEPFEAVIEQFASKIPDYSSIRAKLLHLIKVTKTRRSAYDHYQLHLHDRMKLNDQYQQSATKQRVDFPAKSTWIVFTDQVSHAALSGQYLLEQTFYLPVEAMVNPHLSPLKQWENKKLMKCTLS